MSAVPGLSVSCWKVRRVSPVELDGDVSCAGFLRQLLEGEAGGFGPKLGGEAQFALHLTTLEVLRVADDPENRCG